MITDWKAFHLERWGELNKERAWAVVDFLRSEFTTELMQDIKERIEANSDNWIGAAHFTWGMNVRNALRQHGLGEEYLQVDNLDDYYIALVEVAVLGTPEWMR